MINSGYSEITNKYTQPYPQTQTEEVEAGEFNLETPREQEEDSFEGKFLVFNFVINTDSYKKSNKN